LTSVSYEPLSEAHPAWGALAILPWDVENFGFAVADWRPGDLRVAALEREGLGEALLGWAQRHHAEIVSARVPAADGLGRLLLCDLGFEFIDCSLDLEIADLQAAPIPTPRIPIRLAGPTDHPEIVRIAEEAFQLDRYHADARFPGQLAALRHRRWVQRLVEQPGVETYTTGDAGEPLGFFSVAVAGDFAEIQLAAVDARRHGKGIGFGLFAGALTELKDGGTRRCIGKVYAANTPIINVFAGMGFRFVATQALFHWHLPGAPHMRDWGEILG